MKFAIIAHDKPDHVDLRTQTRPTHLEYIQASGVVTTAGPFVNAAGDMCGSLIVIDVADLATAEEWAAGDPYRIAGLFEHVFVTQWKQVEF